MSNLKSLLAASVLSVSLYSADFSFADLGSMLKNGSALAGFDASVQCSGINIPSFNFGSLIDLISKKIGFCKVSAKEKNLTCLNTLLSRASNPGSLLPANSFLRGGRENPYRSDCGSSSQTYPSLYSVRTISPNLFSYESGMARDCLANGGVNCKASAYTLPTTVAEAREQVATATNMIAGSSGIGSSGDIGAERGLSKMISSKCDGDSAAASCAGKAAIIGVQERTKEIVKNLEKINSAEAVLSKDATTPSKYFFEPDEQMSSSLPIQQRSSFVSIAKRTMAVEAFYKNLSMRIGEAEIELLQAKKNKIAAAAMPVLTGSIEDYVSSVSSSLDDVSDFHTSSLTSM